MGLNQRCSSHIIKLLKFRKFLFSNRNASKFHAVRVAVEEAKNAVADLLGRFVGAYFDGDLKFTHGFSPKLGFR
jgi:hypothetical protein